MRGIALVAAIAFGLVADTALLPCASQAFAISGCCMVRETLSDPWSESVTDRTMEQCEQRNEKDRDNVLDESGLVWWNLNCDT